MLEPVPALMELLTCADVLSNVFQLIINTLAANGASGVVVGQVREGGGKFNENLLKFGIPNCAS